MVRRLFTGALVSIVVAGCATTAVQKMPESWTTVPQARRYEAIALSVEGKVSTIAVPRNALADGEVAVRNGAIARKDNELTPRYKAVESLDVSEERGEVVFSAKRDLNFDIGLVSTDGSHVNWVPEDRADEVDVRWAPRGNKVSFTVRGRTGDLVRTVHIPTSMQLSVDFPWSRVTTLAWDPPAERYAVVVESVESSPRVEVMKYDGTARTVAIPPAVKLDASVEALTEGTLLLRPEPLRYGEKVPLVIWRAEGDRFEWNDARAALMRTARVAVAVTTDISDPEIASRAAEIPWLDLTRVYYVDPSASMMKGMAAGSVTIRAAGDVPNGSWRRNGDVIETAPGVVESFAAGFIADQLKGTSSENGSHR